MSEDDRARIMMWQARLLQSIDLPAEKAGALIEAIIDGGAVVGQVLPVTMET